MCAIFHLLVFGLGVCVGKIRTLLDSNKSLGTCKVYHIETKESKTICVVEGKLCPTKSYSLLDSEDLDYKVSEKALFLFILH